MSLEPTKESKILLARQFFDDNGISYLTIQGGIVLEIKCSRGVIHYKPLSDKFTLKRQVSEKGKGLDKVLSLCENNQG
jgi:hypothetical protein